MTTFSPAQPEPERYRRSLISALAHDLRTPIAPIRSGLKVLASGQLDAPQVQAMVVMMNEHLDQLTQHIDDLLEATRSTAADAPIAGLRVVILRDVLQAAFDSVEPALSVRQQQLVVVEAHLDVALHVDPARLVQVFANILGGSVHATPTGGRIDLSAAIDGREIVITIRDQRAAASTEELDSLFDLFLSGAPNKAPEPMSVGLGLVRGLLALNNGTVQARSEVEGAVFTVRLPISVFTPSAGGTSDAHFEPGQWRSHRILIVDDNQDATRTLALLLELEGQTVCVAHDGPTAVAEAIDFRPEAIVMDIGLPGFSGLHAIEKIHVALASRPPFVVALTGGSSPEEREATKNAGFDLHLTKPVNFAQLKTALTAALRKRA